ncbi:pollen receptor-like kinase 1 [Musa acuminata AAA Group]|uniref:pollen receptor-like kinase 1 n=1 Tax=Musa acuminata AAA Group TaxID=214697 RepID=UPI0031DF264B
MPFLKAQLDVPSGTLEYLLLSPLTNQHFCFIFLVPYNSIFRRSHVHPSPPPPSLLPPIAQPLSLSPKPCHLNLSSFAILSIAPLTAYVAHHLFAARPRSGAMADQATPWPLRPLLLPFPFPLPLPPLLLLLLLFLLLAPFQDAAADAARDADVLLKFKETLGSGGGDVALHNWVAGSSPCRANVTQWAGVLCNLDGSVRGLQLENMSLSGALTTDVLVDLPALRTLSFKNNSFEGSIPDMSKLRALRSLYLSGNKFSGAIPDAMFLGMQWLKKVHLSRNAFTGRIPGSLVGAARLLELRLDDNQFEGHIPDFRQSGLWLVNVSYNNLEGPIPHRLAKMSPNWFEGNEDLCGAPLSDACGSPSTKLSAALIIAIISITISILLVVAALILIARRREKEEEAQTTQLPSSKSIKIEHLPADKPDHRPAHHGGGKKVPKEEQGKLIFVKEGAVKFDIQDLLRASAEVLGSGNFGSSYKAILLEGPAVVVKRFKEMNGVGREDFHEHMRRLGRLSHPNLLPLVAYYYRKEEKLLVTDYVFNGSLAHMLHGGHGSNLPPLDWPARLKIIKGVARGLAYLYEELPMLTVPHGHLKSSNVLLDSAFEPILSDYALVPVMNRTHASQIMVAFKSPECVQSGKPCKKSDVWSFGILMLEILTGKFPANYLRQGRVGTDLASWVNSVVREEWTGEVFDSNMKGTQGGEGEMLKLLHIALACSDTDADKRCELGEALAKIEDLKEYDDGYSLVVG